MFKSRSGRAARTRLGRWASMLVASALLTGTAWGQEPSERATKEQLRRALERARERIRLLMEENATLKGERISTPAVATPTPTPPAPGAASVVVPAPIAEGSAVTVDQMLADYRVSALAGDARFKGRRLRISGTVHSFKKAFVGLGWTVQMKATDQLGMVRCQVQFPGISDFRPYPPTLILEGRRPFREWRPLLQQGERAEFEGVCEGIDEAVIAFRDCKPVTP